MGYIKMFKEFLNELEFTTHWIERTWTTSTDAVDPTVDTKDVIDTNISRALPAKESITDGWECYSVINIATSEEISRLDFLDIALLDEETFNNKISYALHAYLTSKKVKDIICDTATFFKAAYLGKIIFTVNNVKYSPLLIPRKNQIINKDWVGNNMWCIIREFDNAITLKYERDTSDEVTENIIKKAYSDYMYIQNKENAKNKDDKNENANKKDNIMSFDTYKKNFKIIIPFGPNFELNIPEGSYDSSWKSEIKDQINGVEKPIKTSNQESALPKVENLPYIPQGEYSKRKPIRIKVGNKIESYEAKDFDSEKEISVVKFTVTKSDEFRLIKAALIKSGISFENTVDTFIIKKAYKSKVFKK